MFLTRECEMGIRAVLYLAVHGAEGGMGVSEIAQAQHVSPSYLSRAFGRLVKARVLVEEAGGRCRLVRPPEAITMRSLVESFGRPLELTRCLMHHGEIHPCANEAQCELFALWRQLQSSMLRVLESCTLGDMVARAPKPVVR